MYILGKRLTATGAIICSTNPVMHASYEAAKTEAERLAALAVGIEFYIFVAMAVSATRPPPVSTQWLGTVGSYSVGEAS